MFFEAQLTAPPTGNKGNFISRTARQVLSKDLLLLYHRKKELDY
jgi:hypothetical protein